MTYREMQLDVLARLDEQGNTDLQNNIKTWLNQTYQDICNRFNWDFLERSDTTTTTSGTGNYALNTFCTNLKKVYDVTYTSSGTITRLQSIPSDVFEKEYTDTTQTTTGTPTYFHIWNGSIHLYPLPDGADTLTVRYYNYPTDMSNDTDLPLIPLPYHQLIVLGACIAARQFNDEPTPEAELLRRQLEEGIIRMINDLSDSDTTTDNPSIDFIT